MNKYISFAIFLFLALINSSISYAGWYGAHSEFLCNSNCTADGQSDAVNPVPWGWGASYVVQASVVPVTMLPGCGNRMCYYWDSTDPSASASNASAIWKSAPISITLNKSDYGGSGVGGATYKWDAPCSGGGATAFINGQVISQGINGDHTLYLCVADGAGNTSSDISYGPYRHDHDFPTISANLNSPIWKNADITPIVITKNDTGGSGINYAKYSWDSSDATCRSSGTAAAGPISQTTNGAHTLYLCIEDNAGNQASWNGTYNLDKIAPTVSANNGSATWKNTAITITLGVGDTGGSSINRAKYIWNMNNALPGATFTAAYCLANGTSFTNGSQIYRNSAPDQGDHTLYLCAEDVALNTVVQSFGPYRYDTVNPIVSASNNSAVWRNTDYAATLSASDPIPYAGAIVSDTTFVKRKYIWNYNNVLSAGTFTAAYCLANGTSFNNGTIIPVNVEGDHTLYLCSEDQATNQSVVWNGQYRLDKTNPTASSLTYANASTNGWTNNTNITLNWTATDPSGGGGIPSGIQNYDIRVYRIAGAQGTPVALYTTVTTPSAATTYTYAGSDGYAYKFEVCPRDNALNTCTTWLSSGDISRIDTVIPDPNQLSDSSAVNMIATTSQAFNFTYNDGGAPVRMNYTFEQNTNPAASDALITTAPDYAYAHTYNRDISIVDNDRGVNGGRQLSIQITQICDWAGNCISVPSPLKTITHYSYADSANGTVSSTNVGIVDGTAIADGTAKTFETTLKDQFNNQIIPASGIGRSVDLTLSGIVNNMYLDQYLRSGPTSIFLTAPNNVADIPLNFTTTQSFASTMTSSDGKYALQIKAYTPTANSYSGTEAVSDSFANFGFSANFTVSDVLLPNRTFSQTLSSPNFKPLYTSRILGDLLNGGFIEGTEQSSSIIPTINNPGVTPTAIQLQLEFSGANANNFNFYGGNTVGSMTPIGAKNVMSPNPQITGTNLYTTLVQKPNTQVNNLSDLQFSTHYSYTLDAKNIVYNSDIIGRIGGYWSSTLFTVGSQVGVKVIGSIGSNSISSIVTSQFAVGASIFDGYNRSNVRNSIRKSIALATRNSTMTVVAPMIMNVANTEPGSGVNGIKISNNANESIVVLEKNGGAVTKVDLSLVSGISGRRTIVVRGLDLYITNDMYYSTPDSIVGIVVQKDENGNGGNLYINPAITNIVGTYVIDGSVISSSNGTSPIGTSNIGLLKNQLYIFGSIVSENTIGGSRVSPLKCPSLVNTTCGTVDEAQKYDLNYLRRYYLFQGEPFGGVTTKVIGGGTCNSISCSGFNSNLIKKFSLPSEDYARYPVIIEYNPLIRTKSPIGFEETLN